MGSFLRFFTFAAAAILLSSSPAARADVTWTLSATATGDWSVATDWSGLGGPNSSTNADIYNGGTATITQTGEACSSLYLGDSAGSGSIQMMSGSLTVAWSIDVGNSGNGNFSQTGGTNTVSSEVDLGMGTNGNGSYSLGGSGLLSAGGEDVGDSSSSTGSFTQTGGTNAISGTLWLGYWSASSGSYNLSSGSLHASWEDVGELGTGNFTQTGGTNTVSSEVDLGNDKGISGSYSLGGSGLLSAGGEDVGYSSSSTGSFMQTGGTNAISGTLWLGYGSASSGTYSLNGGLLKLAGLNSGSGAATFNFGGGTLQASGSFSTSLPMTLTGSGGNATVDTAGYSVTLSGSLSGLGGLTKTDSGTLVLVGSNTYSGGTIISGGTLQLGNAVGSNGSVAGDITDNAMLTFANPTAQTYPGTLSGSGSVTKTGSGALTLTGSNIYTGGTTISAGTLQIGAGSSGSIASNVTDNATLAFDVSSGTFSHAISGGGSVLQMANALMLTGHNTYMGATTISGGTLVVGGTTALGNSSAVSISSGAVLDLGGYSPAIGSLSGACGGVVTNNAAGGGTATLTLAPEFVTTATFAGVIQNGPTANVALTLYGSVTEVLTGSNTYTGATAITAGTLQVGSGGATGSLGATTVADHGMLVFDLSVSSAFSGAVTGTGSLTQIGRRHADADRLEHLHGRHHDQRRHSASGQRRRAGLDRQQPDGFHQWRAGPERLQHRRGGPFRRRSDRQPLRGQHLHVDRWQRQRQQQLLGHDPEHFRHHCPGEDRRRHADADRLEHLHWRHDNQRRHLAIGRWSQQQRLPVRRCHRQHHAELCQSHCPDLQRRHQRQWQRGEDRRRHIDAERLEQLHRQHPHRRRHPPDGQQQCPGEFVGRLDQQRRRGLGPRRQQSDDRRGPAPPAAW